MIGNGVNFASRLESAANPFRIMLSEQAIDLIDKNIYDQQHLQEIFFKIKHKSSFIKAFEYDPFVKEPKRARTVEKAYFEQVDLCPKQRRYDLNHENGIKLRSELGELQLLDYSLDGFGVVASFLVGNKSPLTVTMETTDETFNQRLKEKILDKIEVEVRWSRRKDSIFFHGLKISGLTDAQKSYIFIQLSNLDQNGHSLYESKAS